MASTFAAPASWTRFRPRSFVSDIIKGMQVSRMRSVLSQMNDRQLAEIGITRSQLDAHAKALVTR